MKIIIVVVLSILLLLTITSCNEFDKQKFEHIEVYTQDSLYVIKSIFPERFDTIHSWVHFNDNDCADILKIRFDNSHLPIEQEAGFYWFSNDSLISRITFEHIYSYNCKNRTKQNSKDLYDYAKLILEGQRYKDEELRIEEDGKIKTIGETKMILIKFIVREKYGDRYIGNIYFQYDLNPMVIRSECVNVDCEHFFEDIDKVFESVQISKVEL